MKERILKIMQQEKMTQQNFAAALGISPASLSSIFNGRTNPTNNHVNAIHRRFPNISIEWLMFGEGDMYIQSENAANLSEAKNDVSPTLGFNFEGNSAEQSAQSSQPVPTSPTFSQPNTAVPVPAPTKETIRETIKYIDKPQRNIKEIRVFFDDGTYEIFAAGK